MPIFAILNCSKKTKIQQPYFLTKKRAGNSNGTTKGACVWTLARKTLKQTLKWEFPVTSQSSSTTGYTSSKNIIGFIDIKIRFKYSELSLTGIDFENKIVKDEIRWVQTTEKIDYTNGYTDGYNVYSVYLEIKTKIPSLGELFRQLKMYQVYIKGDFVVVCPDDKERKLIEDQGLNL